MKRITLIFTVFAILAGSAFSAFAQSNNGKIVEQILKLENDLLEATKKLSAEDLERFYTADFMMTVRIPPQIVNREQRLAHLKDANFQRGTVESLVNSDVKVRVYGNDTAIVTAAWKRVSKDADGKDTSASGRFTHIWVKQNGKWLLAGVHYSPDIDLEKLKAENTQPADKKN